MSILIMRYHQGHFIVSGPDIEPIKFTRGFGLAVRPASDIHRCE